MQNLTCERNWEGLDMDKKEICDSIMYEAACTEERRMLRTFLLLGPLLIVCSWLIVVSLYLTVLEFQESKIYEKIEAVQKESVTATQKAGYIASLFWDETRKDLFVILLSAVGVLAFASSKSKLFSYPTRIKEINKYKLLKSRSAQIS